MIKYKGGFKYQLAESYRVQIPIRGKTILQGPISLTVDGFLSIDKSYAWDGPSGPAIDTKNFMRGSLVHDALYQLMREGRLEPGVHRGPADQLLRRICREDGMSAVRAWWVYKSVHYFGSPAADFHNKKEILTAP